MDNELLGTGHDGAGEHDASAVLKRQFLLLRHKYETKIQELSVIKQLVEALRLTGRLERNLILGNQVEIIRQYFGAERALLLLSELPQQFEVVIDTAGGDGAPFDRPLDGGSGILGQLCSQQRPVACRDMVADGTDLERGLLRGRSCLAVPLLQHHACIGALFMVYSTVHECDPNQINFSTLVADQLATTVMLTRLYGQMLREETKRLTLSRFFSRSVIDKILDGRGIIRLGGERKLVTIVFADLRGFTALSETLDQDQVVTMLNAYFSALTPVVFKHEGTLDKLLGDGLMAVFGAPLSRDDDPLRAVNAVIELVQTLKLFNRQHQAEGWPQLRIGIGVNTGEVVAGYIGSEDHLNYTVVGDAVNTAQRIQTLAGEDEIYISASLYRAIAADHDKISGLKGITALPPQQVKGKKKPLEIFRVEY